MENAIEIKNLTKNYGRQRGIENINCVDLNKWEIIFYEKCRFYILEKHFC